MNLSEYLSSKPLLGSDELGLFFGGFSGAAISTAIGMYDTVDDLYNTLLQGSIAYTQILGMTSSYFAFQEADMDWAMDWSLDDEGSSHSVSFVLRQGVWADEDDPGLATDPDTGNPIYQAGITLGPKQNRANYEQERSRWGAVRQSFWRQEAKRAGTKGALNKWSRADVARMKQGLAPDGWIVHHRKPLAHGGTSKDRNLVVMRRSDHTANLKGMHSPPYRLPGRTAAPRGPSGPRIMRPGRRR